MTEPETKEEKKIEISLDATMLDTFVSCPAKFNMRFNMNRVTPGKPAPLDRGGLEHKGFEGYYKGLQKGDDFSNSLEAGVSNFNQATVDSELDPPEITALRKTLIENITYWRRTDERLEILGVEEPFAYELFSDDVVRITMIGIIDLFLNDQRLGKHPLDHKTYSSTRPVFRKTNQFCNYAYATGSPYLMVNLVGLQTSIPMEKRHRRKPLSYDSLFLDQWKMNVVKWCYYYLECHMNNDWPLNDTSCDKWNRLCEYYDVCDSSGIEAKIYKLNTDFKIGEKWDVAKSLGLDKTK